MHQIGLLPIIRQRDCVIEAPPSNDRMTTLCIGILQRLDPSLTVPQVVVVVHDHETAHRLNDTLVRLGKFMDLSTCLLTSDSIDKDEKLKIKHHPPSIIIITPAALLAAIRGKVIDCVPLAIFCIEDATISFPVVSYTEAADHDNWTVRAWLTDDPQRVVFTSVVNEGIKIAMQRDFKDPLSIVVRGEDSDEASEDSDGFEFL